MADTEYSKPVIGFGTAQPQAGAAQSETKAASSGDPGRRRGKLRHRASKRTKANVSKQPKESLEPAAALAKVKAFTAPKFDQSVDVVFNLGIDTKQADQQIRGSVALPKGIGKSKRVVAFCGDDLVAAAKAAGAVDAGGESLVAKIDKGWMEFDVAIASPEMMRVISKLGRVLGPKGLMPSPKAGTVTKDVVQAVGEYSAGKLEYRADKEGNVHVTIGRMSFSEADLLVNFEHMLETIRRAQPAGLKGIYIKSVHVSGTMTPSVRIKHGGEVAVEAE